MIHPRWQPRVELVKWKRIDFYPPRRTDWSQLDEICIGSKTRTIGDALMLSPLPRKLKEKFPHLRITTYPRAFNPVVFYQNPFVDGVSYLPDSLYGDDSNWERGHLLQLKEHFFGLPVSAPPRPEIFLTQKEVNSAQALINRLRDPRKKLCLVHPWGHTWTQVAQKDYWTTLIQESQDWEFWQVGVAGHDRLPGVHQAFLPAPRYYRARSLFALTQGVDAFIGVNSGPMHIATAFQKPALILTEQGNLSEIFKNRLEFSWFLKKNWAHGFLYPQNQHLDLPSFSKDQAVEQTLTFLETVSDDKPNE